MSETPEKNEYFQDHLVVRHSSGKSEKFPVPTDEEAVIRIGRELDNDIVLTDARASRYHAEIRRKDEGLQIKDLNSANGIQVGVNRIKPDTWEKITAGQTVQLGETRLFWEKAASSQSTVAMPLQRPAADAATPAPAAAAPIPAGPQQNLLPWAIGGGIILLLLILAGLGLLFGWFGGGEQVAGQPTGQTVPSGRATDGSLAQQTPGGAGPTNTPTPSGPQLALPVVNIVSTEVRPIVLGALPSTDKALLLINVRVENVGNAPFIVSTNDFSVRTRDGQTLAEAGGTTSEEGLSRLGVKDRFDDLTLTPGGSVPESLIFEVGAEDYDAELVFEAPNLEPLVLGLGTIYAGRELATALGTPVADETPVAAAATPTLEPTPTPTRPAAIPAPQVVSRSALVGTIAYPVFNGDDFDLYLGKVDGSGTRFYRARASQPDFNADGTRIAFHSWAGDSSGLVTMDVTGANPRLIANFVEDQLPTWTLDSQSIILLTRRTGGRQSQLIKASSTIELDEGVILGEGEYPSIGATGELAFKGWGNTAFGLRVATDSLEDIQTVTNVDGDTAPDLSPDGNQIVFMSRREENNWDIYVINRDGSGLQRLTVDPADDGLPTWSPDGNAIAFVSNRGGPWAVWAMTPEGKGLRQLFTMEGSPDGFVGTDTYASRGWAEERISWTAADLE